MIAHIINTILLILSWIFIYKSNVLSINYNNIFEVLNNIQGINTHYFIAFIITKSIFLSISIFSFIKSDKPHYNILLPLIIFTSSFIVLNPSSLFIYIIIILSITIQTIISKKGYEKKFIYKIVPYGELSHKTLSKITIILVLTLTSIITYNIINNNNYQIYTDNFIYKYTNINMSEDHNKILASILDDQIQKQIDQINQLKEYLKKYAIASHSQCSDECSEIIDNAFNNLQIDKNNIKNTINNKEIEDKINIIFNIRNTIIKFYPLIAFITYYSLLSFIFWIINVLSWIILAILERIVR